MRLLLDTHVLLWWLERSPMLADAHRSAIADQRHEVLVSSVTIAEIAIKTALGKLRIPDDPIGVVIAEEGFEELAFRSEHADALRELPLLHRGPFDRMLIAQPVVEDAVLVTADAAVRQYAVPTI